MYVIRPTSELEEESVEGLLASIPRESSFQLMVVYVLEELGWTVVHINDMRGNEPGIPDLLCFRGERGMMIELKIGDRPLSEAQLQWHTNRAFPKTPVYVWRNTDDDWLRMVRLAV